MDIIKLRMHVRLLTCPCCGDDVEVYEEFKKVSISEHMPEITELKAFFYVRCLGCELESGRVLKDQNVKTNIENKWNNIAKRKVSGTYDGMIKW